MSKKQKTLGFFGFTKTIKRREKLVKIDILEETKGNSALLACNYCDKSLKTHSHFVCISNVYILNIITQKIS